MTISLNTAERILEKTLTLIGVVCLSGIVVVIILNVLLRFVFNAPITWSMEGSSILVVWMTYIAFGVNHRNNLHFRIDAVTQLLPANLQQPITTIADVLTLVCLGFLLYSSLTAIADNGSMPMMTIEVPVFYTFYLPMLIGIFSYILYIFRSLILKNEVGEGKS